MPSTSFDLSSPTAPLMANAPFVGAYRYGGSGSKLQLIANVIPTECADQEGSSPPTARFRYLTDSILSQALGWPDGFEDLWPIDAQGPYVVQPDDRLVIASPLGNGQYRFFFDGFAQIPQVDVGPHQQQVGFAAVGTPIRCFDKPISGRTQRNADPTNIAVLDGSQDIKIDRPCHFNPVETTVGVTAGYTPNATKQDSTVQTSAPDGSSVSYTYPVFLEPNGDLESRNPDPRKHWTVSTAVKFFLAEYNLSQKYVNNPDFDTLSNILVAYSPAEGYDTIDPTNPATFDRDHVRIRDYDASNKLWPIAVEELVAYCGLVMRWDLASTGTEPQWTIKFYRRDEMASGTPKSLLMAAQGATSLDPTANNASSFHLARDCNRIVNAWQVETAQRTVEVSVVLAPLYQPKAGDEQPGTDASGTTAATGRNQFFPQNWLPTTKADVRRKYRWYGADECGDGHWDVVNKKWVTTPFDFSPIFPPEDSNDPNEPKTPSYVARYRPASHRLISKDSDGNPLKARLYISFDYTPALGFWDGENGTWFEVTSGWALLEDRLGIRVTIKDPEQWGSGNKGIKSAPTDEYPVGGGDIRGITWWSAPPSGTPFQGQPPALRLTTVIEDDLRMPITADMRSVSPTQFARWRTADAREIFQYATIDKSSDNYTSQGGNGTDPYVARDDTKAADAHAYSLRSVHEFPPLAGSIQIPFLTQYYRVGERVKDIKGRGASLATNVGGNNGEAICYPWIISRHYTFDGGQRTVLQVSDARAMRNNL